MLATKFIDKFAVVNAEVGSILDLAVNVPWSDYLFLIEIDLFQSNDVNLTK